MARFWKRLSTGGVVQRKKSWTRSISEQIETHSEERIEQAESSQKKDTLISALLSEDYNDSAGFAAIVNELGNQSRVQLPPEARANVVYEKPPTIQETIFLCFTINNLRNIAKIIQHSPTHDDVIERGIESENGFRFSQLMKKAIKFVTEGRNSGVRKYGNIFENVRLAIASRFLECADEFEEC